MRGGPVYAVSVHSHAATVSDGVHVCTGRNWPQRISGVTREGWCLRLNSGMRFRSVCSSISKMQNESKPVGSKRTGRRGDPSMDEFIAASSNEPRPSSLGAEPTLIEGFSKVRRFVDSKLPGFMPTVLLLDTVAEQYSGAGDLGVHKAWNALRGTAGMQTCSRSAQAIDVGKRSSETNSAQNECAIVDAEGWLFGQSDQGAWTVPILSEDLRILGTMIFFCRRFRAPSEMETKLMKEAVDMAAVAIQREELRSHAEQPCGPRGQPNVKSNRSPVFIGESNAMQRVYHLVSKLREQSFPVLIVGETGTGKELVARSLHFSGTRRQRPFVAVDCSCFVPTLVETELFGYAKGAFTGADQRKPGLIETAKDGTLFLDEIGDLPMELQPKLLRVLQEREIRLVGSTSAVPFSARIIAATNQDLEAAVNRGAFRHDLYCRLNVVQIEMPPLRERKEDIGALIDAFLGKFTKGTADDLSISTEAMACLMAYDWPGNVRELENTVQRALALGSGSVLRKVDLPPSITQEETIHSSPGFEPVPLELLQRRAILDAVRDFGGDVAAAARYLGIGKTTCYRKLKSYKRAPLVQ
jgi:DNA-binding NtrC family response regulator